MLEQQAAAQIRSIHEMLHRTSVFRGYRSTPTLFSAVLSVAAALIQPLLISSPTVQLDQYIMFWGSVAVVSLLGALWSVSSPGQGRNRRWQALMPLLPAFFVGTVVTVLIACKVRDAGWMLPGLWALMFGIAVCSACAQLPRLTWIGGGYFLATGTAVLFIFDADLGLHPSAMVVTFTFGQLLNAMTLYWTLERHQLIGCTTNEQ